MYTTKIKTFLTLAALALLGMIVVTVVASGLIYATTSASCTPTPSATASQKVTGIQKYGCLTASQLITTSPPVKAGPAAVTSGNLAPANPAIPQLFGFASVIVYPVLLAAAGIAAALFRTGAMLLPAVVVAWLGSMALSATQQALSWTVVVYPGPGQTALSVALAVTFGLTAAISALAAHTNHKIRVAAGEPSVVTKLVTGLLRVKPMPVSEQKAETK